MSSSVTKTTRAHSVSLGLLWGANSGTSAANNWHFGRDEYTRMSASVTKTTRTHSVSLGAVLGQVVWTTETAELMNTQATLGQMLQTADMNTQGMLSWAMQTTWAHSVSLGVSGTHQDMSKNSNNFSKRTQAQPGQFAYTEAELSLNFTIFF